MTTTMSKEQFQELLRPLAQLEQRAQHLFDTAQALHEGWPEAGGEIGRLSRVLRHVAAERAQLESFNAQVMRKLSSVMAAAPVGICFTRDKRFVLVSAEFCRLFGRSEAEMLGQPASSIYASNEDHQAIGPQVLAAFREGKPYQGEWQMLRADGSRFWGQLRGRPVADGDVSAGTIWSTSQCSTMRPSSSKRKMSMPAQSRPASVGQTWWQCNTTRLPSATVRLTCTRFPGYSCAIRSK